MWKAGFVCFCVYTACLLDVCYAKIGYEGSQVTFKAIYTPDYKTDTKYFGKHGVFFFEKLVETSHPNRCVKQGRFTLFDNTSACVLTATILNLVLEDSGSYSFGVDITLMPDPTGEEIQLTVIRGEAQRPITPAPTPKVIISSTSSPVNITAQNWDRTRDQESYVRFVTVLSLVCVCTLLVVCPFGLFKVLKYATASKLSVSVSYHRKTTAQVVDEYVKMSSVAFTNPPTARSDKGSVIPELHRPANTEPDPSTDACCTDAVQPDLDQIYTEMNPDVVQESIYQSIDQTTD
ncbi:uncharacterized protein LOC113119346 [Carassius auratus]|uniref:Uncharacterized protein LOC113119346 n=1 Tax=Carassius auratus TaxID=7957 RepID=A0A6P6RGP3_CARAU|nr:uncharacterized protein LOC113119346 [Carassius auratus]